MPRRLKFSTYRTDVTAEPIEVELNEDDVFYFKPTMPGISLLGFLEDIDSPSNRVASKAIRELFRETLVTDPTEFPDANPPIPETNAEDFFAYVTNKDNRVGLPELQEIANGVVEAIAGGRPTESSQTSDGGSATNGSGSTAKRSAKAATSKR
jgi:hypothetical protein